MKTKQQKEKSLKEYQTKLGKAKITIFTSFAQQGADEGIGVKDLQQLRSSLRNNDAQYVVEKKRLIARAVENKKGLDVTQYDGSIGTIFGYGDEVSAAKAAYDFSKDHPALKLYGGIFGDKVIDQAKVITLATLPGRDALIGQFANLMVYPLQGLAIVLQAGITGLAVALNQVIAQKSN